MLTILIKFTNWTSTGKVVPYYWITFHKPFCRFNFILFTQIFATTGVEFWPEFDNIKVLLHWTRNEGENCVFGIQDPKGPFIFSINIKVCVDLRLHQFLNCVYGNINVDTENGYRTHSLHLHFATIVCQLFLKAQGQTLTLSLNWPLHRALLKNGWTQNL